MNWKSVIGQEHVVEVLRRDLETDHVPHAYLFHGPDGVGKRAAALALAQALTCERGGPDPCESCEACRKVSRLIHPDVRVHIPQPKKASVSDVAERVRRLAEEPYATVDFSRRPSLDDAAKQTNAMTIYNVDRVREEFRRQMSMSPAESAYKIAILTDADAMQVEAANAFLKTLEEPPPRSIFILTTQRPESLLPTVLSRCRRLRFDPLPAAAVEDALVQRRGVERPRAAMISRMSDGSYSRALELLDNEILAMARDQVVEFIRRSHMMEVSRILDIVDWVASFNREHVKSVLNLMLTWLRDLVVFRTTRDPEALVNVDQLETITRFSDNLPQADIPAMVAAVEQALYLAERNVRPDTIMVALSQLFHRATHGQSAGKLFVPLSEPV